VVREEMRARPSDPGCESSRKVSCQ
jgi:hypothetical protein